MIALGPHSTNENMMPFTKLKIYIECTATPPAQDRAMATGNMHTKFQSLDNNNNTTTVSNMP